MDEFFSINPNYSKYIYENCESFRGRFNQLLKTKNLSIEEFEALHHFQHIDEICSGDVIPCDSTVNSLAEALGVSEQFLVYGN